MALHESIRRPLINAFIQELLQSKAIEVDGPYLYEQKNTRRCKARVRLKRYQNGMSRFSVRTEQVDRIFVSYNDILYTHYHGPIEVGHVTLMPDHDDLATLKSEDRRVVTSRSLIAHNKSRESYTGPHINQKRMLSNEQVDQIRASYRNNSKTSINDLIAHFSIKFKASRPTIHHALCGRNAYTNLNCQELPVLPLERSERRKAQIPGKTPPMRPLRFETPRPKMVTTPKPKPVPKVVQPKPVEPKPARPVEVVANKFKPMATMSPVRSAKIATDASAFLRWRQQNSQT